MPLEESHYAKDWLRIAEKDWRRLDQALDDGDPEEAGFWLQQALEKYLKAYLLLNGWALRKIHDLEVLINEASTFTKEFGQYAPACRRISGYYIAERYPLLDSPAVTLGEVSRSRDGVAELVTLIKHHLK
jgi:HEPN domain-containing protein